MNRLELKDKSWTYRQNLRIESRKRLFHSNRNYVESIAPQIDCLQKAQDKMTRLLKLVRNLEESRINDSYLLKLTLLRSILPETAGQNSKVFDIICQIILKAINVKFGDFDDQINSQTNGELYSELFMNVQITNLRILMELAEESIELRYLILNSVLVGRVISEAIFTQNIVYMAIASSLLNSLISSDPLVIERYKQNEYFRVFHKAFVKLNQHYSSIKDTNFPENSLFTSEENQDIKISLSDTLEGVSKSYDMMNGIDIENLNSQSSLLLNTCELFKKFKSDLLVFNNLLSVFESLSGLFEIKECDYLVSDCEIYNILKSKLLSQTIQMDIKKKIIFVIGNCVITSPFAANKFFSDPQFVEFILGNIVEKQNTDFGEDCLLCLCNLTKYNEQFVVSFISNYQIIEYLFALVSNINDGPNECMFIRIFLEALENLLRLDRHFNFQLQHEIANSDKIETLSNLQYHKNNLVYERVYSILNEFFEEIIDN
jgi:hypothetical protein